MRKLLIIFIVLLILTPLGAKNSIKISLKIEGAWNTMLDTYSYDLWEEKSIYEGNIEGRLFLTYGIHLGFNLSPRISLWTGYTYGKNQMLGTFILQIPNPWFYNKPQELSWENKALGYETHIIDLGFRYNFMENNRFNLFFYGGISYYLINFPTYFDAELLWEFPDTLTISDIEYNEYIPRAFGIQIGFGCSCPILKICDLEFSIIYRQANVSIPVRINTAYENTLEFNPGGISPVLSLTIKI